jgi:hypothetical protein
MISQTATALTLLATLLHSMLGCCWHHAHVCACASSGRSPTVRACSDVEQACHAGTCRHHHAIEHAATDVPASDEPVPSGSEREHEHGRCVEGDCVYLASKMLEFSASDLIVAAMELPPAAIVAATAGRFGSFSCGHGDQSLIAPPRQRALLQVWLI